MIGIYAAGPIEGCTMVEALGWRKNLAFRFTKEIRQGQVIIYDPMHGKEKLVAPDKKIVPENYRGNSPLATGPAIFHRDIAMIDQCDVVLANFAAANAASKGTLFELGYAFALGKMLIVVSKREGITNHPFINIPAIVYPDINDAIVYIKSLVTSGFGGAYLD